jgi:hypothetical protein
LVVSVVELTGVVAVELSYAGKGVVALASAVELATG